MTQRALQFETPTADTHEWKVVNAEKVWHVVLTPKGEPTVDTFHVGVMTFREAQRIARDLNHRLVAQ